MHTADVIRYQRKQTGFLRCNQQASAAPPNSKQLERKIMAKVIIRASVLLVGLMVSAAQSTPTPAQPQRPRAPQRQPELYEQNTPPTAMGLWFDGVTVGVIGWEGQSVPRGAQVAIKGRNFVGRGALVILKHSVLGELTDTVYLLPRTHFDTMPVQMESCAFELPPVVVGIIEIRLWVDGIESNAVRFHIE